MTRWIAFDADDTLWHNETIFADAQAKFRALLAPYGSADEVNRVLYEVEMKNLSFFGYGVKGFTFSMIETAIEMTGGDIPGSEIQKLVNIAKDMLRAPVELLDGVADVVAQLAPSFNLMALTKGDLLDQENKLKKSGLAEHFDAVEIVSEKTPEVYAGILEKHRIAPGGFLMVGNSLRSDILPVIEAGARAVHIPYHITWAHETHADAGDHEYGELESVRDLPAYLKEVSWL